MNDSINNLKTVVSVMSEFYKRQLGVKFSRKEVNIENLVNKQDYESLFKLGELLLGVIISCDESETYVNELIGLDQDH